MSKQQQGYNLFLENALKYGFSLFGLPKTDQVVSYAEGDDGFYQKGFPASDDRFLDHGDGTVTDRATGLMWKKVGFQEGKTWAEALAAVEALDFAGYTDWRLPNIVELNSIVDYESSGPYFYHMIFTLDGNTGYWTSSSWAGYPLFAWMMSFGSLLRDMDDKESLYYYMAVRGM